jgi:hypothetical protein
MTGMDLFDYALAGLSTAPKAHKGRACDRLNRIDAGF